MGRNNHLFTKLQPILLTNKKITKKVIVGVSWQGVWPSHFRLVDQINLDAETVVANFGREAQVVST